jgi:hypothetical protein
VGELRPPAPRVALERAIATREREAAQSSRVVLDLEEKEKKMREVIGDNQA